MSKNKNDPSTNMLNNPHDKAFKAMMKHPSAAKEFLQAVLPASIAEQVEWDKVKLVETAFVDEALQHQESDVVFELPVADETGFCFCLVEHQSSPDAWLPLRILRYVTRLLTEQSKRKDIDRLPAVYPVIFYHGRRSPYLYPLSMAALMAKDGHNFNFWSEAIPLFDINTLADGQVLEYQWISGLILIMKLLQNHDFPPLIQQLGQIMGELPPTHEGLAFLKILINYMQYTFDEKDFKQVINTISNQLSDEQNSQIQTMAQVLENKGLKEGLQKGRQEGLEEGLQKGRQEIALTMLKQDFTIQQISNVTGLSIDEIKKLQVT